MSYTKYLHCLPAIWNCYTNCQHLTPCLLTLHRNSFRHTTHLTCMSEDRSAHLASPKYKEKTQHQQINPATMMLRWKSYHRKHTAPLQHRTRLFPQLHPTSTFLGAHRSQIPNSYRTPVEFAQTLLSSTKSSSYCRKPTVFIHIVWKPKLLLFG